LRGAPYFKDVAEAPDGRALWLKTGDEVTIRTVVWPTGNQGTVFLFPGRTEYAEKFGRIAGDLARAGYSSLAIDWRGQGLADRALRDPMIGHVSNFLEYQHDVRSVVAMAEDLDLPRPWHVMANSMGGAIALRTLTLTDTFASAVFSSPMWGIIVPRGLKHSLPHLTRLGHLVGQGQRLMPSRTNQSYVLTHPFEDNDLTCDPEVWNYMRRQAQAQPRFQLGGPSVSWAAAALAETRALRRTPLPDIPVRVGLGTEERIVDPAAIYATVDRWGSATLTMYSGARHELMMETPPIRDGFLANALALFSTA
jgi:lysophospholipase